MTKVGYTTLVVTKKNTIVRFRCIRVIEIFSGDLNACTAEYKKKFYPSMPSRKYIFRTTKISDSLMYFKQECEFQCFLNQKLH